MASPSWRHLVSADAELPAAHLGVPLQQRGAHGEHLLHHRVLPQVVLALRAKVIVRVPQSILDMSRGLDSQN